MAFAQIESAEARFALQAALKMLDDDGRQILLLHAVGGLTNREIAAVLEMPLNTVLSKYHRTIKKMRNLLESEGFSKRKMMSKSCSPTHFRKSCRRICLKKSRLIQKMCNRKGLLL